MEPKEETTTRHGRAKAGEHGGMPSASLPHPHVVVLRPGRLGYSLLCASVAAQIYVALAAFGLCGRVNATEVNCAERVKTAHCGREYGALHEPSAGPQSDETSPVEGVSLNTPQLPTQAKALRPKVVATKRRPPPRRQVARRRRARTACARGTAKRKRRSRTTIGGNMSRALLVGLSEYNKEIPPLKGCANDAREMAAVLRSHEDGSPNYDCIVLTSPGSQTVTRKLLRKVWSELFNNYDEDILFYFSGHGHSTDIGGYLVTQDAEDGDPGLSMNDLLTLANKSKARSVLLILDCCFAGWLGDPAVLQGDGSIENRALLRKGLTILAASMPAQTAGESGGLGIFTRLVVGALKGGAADMRGNVTAAAVYAYVEQALGDWEQRPVYKSHEYRFQPIRHCAPSVPDSLLRELPAIFKKADDPFQMAPSYEFTHASCDPAHVKLFEKFKVLRNARLLTTDENKDLFFIALESGRVWLTPLGQFYWQLARDNRIRR
jgi:hypothetical protein